MNNLVKKTLIGALAASSILPSGCASKMYGNNSNFSDGTKGYFMFQADVDSLGLRKNLKARGDGLDVNTDSFFIKEDVAKKDIIPFLPEEYQSRIFPGTISGQDYIFNSEEEKFRSTLIPVEKNKGKNFYNNGPVKVIGGVIVGGLIYWGVDYLNDKCNDDDKKDKQISGGEEPGEKQDGGPQGGEQEVKTNPQSGGGR